MNLQPQFLVPRDIVVYITIVILIVIFCVQRFGTDKVGCTFAPAICVWFLFISGIGAYNLFKYEPGVLRAFNPMYIVSYFQRNGHTAWVSLGGVVLCITGTEAMFADLGHFNLPAVQHFGKEIISKELQVDEYHSACNDCFSQFIKALWRKLVPLTMESISIIQTKLQDT